MCQVRLDEGQGDTSVAPELPLPHIYMRVYTHTPWTLYFMSSVVEEVNFALFHYRMMLPQINPSTPSVYVGQ